MITIFTDLCNLTYECVDLSIVGIFCVSHNDLDCQRLVVQIAKVGNFCVCVSLDAIFSYYISVAGQNLVFLTINLKCHGIGSNFFDLAFGNRIHGLL